MYRKLAAILLVLAMLLSLAACSGAARQTNTPSQSTTPPAQPAATKAPAAQTQTQAPATQAPQGGQSDFVDPTGKGMTAPGQFPVVTQPYSFTAVAPDATYLSDFNNNKFTQWYEEKTGVHVEWTNVASASKTEQINLMLTSGTYPDMFVNAGFGTAGLVEYGSQGFFVDLTEYIDQYAHYLKDMYELYPQELPGKLITPDGAIYGLPNINDCFHCNNSHRAYINQLWLDSLGLSMPETTDDLYDVLVAFRDNDPNGNGAKDEIPMMGANQTNFYPHTFLLNAFIYCDRQLHGLYMDSGTVKFALQSEEYRQGLEYIKKLFDEGLIDKTSLTQPKEALKQAGTNPDAQLLGVAITTNWWDALGYYPDTADQRANNYSSLPPIKGPNGLKYSPTTSQAVGVGHLVVTDKCEFPQIAVRWADGLYSEEVTLRSQIGVEGLDWEFASAGDLGIHQQQALYRKLDHVTTDDYMYSTLRNALPAARTSDFRLGEYVDYSDPMAVLAQEPRLYALTLENYYPYRDTSRMIPTLYYTSDESSEYSRLKTQIEAYVQEACVAFITGNRDLAGGWEAYKAEFAKLELDKYLSLIQTAYDRQYK